MPLTDANGDPIPEDDPRLPTMEATDEVIVQNRAKLVEIVQMGFTVDKEILELRGQMKALVSLMVPPEGPVRRLFDHRQRVAEGEVLDQMLVNVAKVREKAMGLQVAKAVPESLQVARR